MSDFLSKFNGDNYQEWVDEKEQKKDDKNPPENETPESNEEAVEVPKDEQSEIKQEGGATPKERASEVEEKQVKPVPLTKRASTEETEIDPTYQKKKRRKRLLIGIGSVLICLLLYLFYYNSVHVNMPDFKDKPVSEVTKWATKNNIELDLKQEFSVEVDKNAVISQEIEKNKKVRKGKTLSFTVSQGADPDEIIKLPDFSKMEKGSVDEWIEKNKAEGIKIVLEFNNEIAKNKVIKFEIKDPNIVPAEYKRKDYATVYISKGKEVFEKNISVPDFNGKTKTEVEQWAKTNEINVTYEEADSNEVETDKIISQSIAASEKVAKHDEMTVTVSLGKATVVPNFAHLTPDEASSIPNLTVRVRKQFHSSVPFGGLIAQTVAPETRLTGKDEVEIVVTYSEGAPFLKDYKGQVVGDLPRLFYEDYHAKGANINYTLAYVDSYETKGTVVSMSNFNEYVGMTYQVTISISKGNLEQPAGYSSKENDPVEEMGEE